MVGWLVGKNPDVFKGVYLKSGLWQGNEDSLKNVDLLLYTKNFPSPKKFSPQNNIKKKETLYIQFFVYKQV